MTKDEFIDKYMADSKLKPEYRTRDGFTIPDDEPRIALPCDCGDELCLGWQMIRVKADREAVSNASFAPDPYNWTFASSDGPSRVRH